MDDDSSNSQQPAEPPSDSDHRSEIDFVKEATESLIFLTRFKELLEQHRRQDPAGKAYKRFTSLDIFRPPPPLPSSPPLLPHKPFAKSSNVLQRLRQIEAEMRQEALHDPIAAHNAAGVAYAIKVLELQAETPTKNEDILALIEDYLDIPWTLKVLKVGEILDGDVQDQTLWTCLKVLNLTAYACAVGRKIVLALSALSPGQRWVLLNGGTDGEMQYARKRYAKGHSFEDEDYRSRIGVGTRWDRPKDWLIQKERQHAAAQDKKINDEVF